MRLYTTSHSKFETFPDINNQRSLIWSIALPLFSFLFENGVRMLKCWLLSMNGLWTNSSLVKIHNSQLNLSYAIYKQLCFSFLVFQNIFGFNKIYKNSCSMIVISTHIVIYAAVFSWRVFADGCCKHPC